MWIEAARRALIEEGIGGVKVDRLAETLGVTRGGFYHNFKDREELLDRLLDLWEAQCRFLPGDMPGTTAAAAAEWIERATLRLIEEDGYDPRFDMSVREWARSDPRAAWAVERADRERMETLRAFFEALGYVGDEAVTRARVFYFHQIGYYAIGMRLSIGERRRTARIYVDILCGHDVMQAARAALKSEVRVGETG
jgi:AcrR family transcriptional regulator